MPNLAALSPGPLERTALEMGEIARAAAFRRERVAPTRRCLRTSDALLDLVEECRVLNFALVPSAVWSVAVRLVGEVDGDGSLRDELGIDRRIDHVWAILFRVQALLLERARYERLPGLAPIIPLFRTSGSASATTV